MNNWPRLKAYLEGLPQCRDRDSLLSLASGKCFLKKSRPVTAMQRKEKRESLPSLKKQLDTVFSTFIRQRDSNDNGIGTCVTCGRTGRWQDMDCGHYQPRQDLNTRWTEHNCHLQCKPCNGFRGGEAEKMAAYIDKTYGKHTALALQAKAKVKCRLDRHKLKLWITHYTNQIKADRGYV